MYILPDMKTTVQKWGNSLGVRLHASVATSVSLHVGDEVTITAHNDSLVIVPTGKASLAQLCDQIKPENCHGVVEYGSSVGNELW
jgi:antitoxin MazE